MKKFLLDLLLAVAAGIMISVGGIVFLACESKALGAFLFAVGLMAICEFGLNLYTGKIGYTVCANQPPILNRIGFVATVWLGNLLGAFLGGTVYSLAKTTVCDKASELCYKKLTTGYLSPFILGIFCGILMFVAVDIFKRNAGSFSKFLGIFIGVPVFILAGFEHSIADMAYFALAGKLFSFDSLLFILLVTLGNTLGGMMIPCVLRIKDKVQ